MGMSLEKTILAIISTQRDNISGGAPIFYVKDENELQQKAAVLEAILDGIAHEIDNSTFIVVRH